MSNNAKRGYVVLAILLAVFSVIAFAVPFCKSATFAVAYVFGVIAIAFQVYFFNVSFNGQETAKSRFYGLPIARIGVVYLVVQLLLSVAEMALAGFLPVWVPVVINMIVLAIAAVGCIAAETMREEIVKQDVKIKTDVNNMRELQSLSASLVGLCRNEGMKKQLQNLADDFKYSDPVSSEDTKDMEMELKFLVGEIQRALIDGDINVAEGFCKRVKVGLRERNRVCKIMK